MIQIPISRHQVSCQLHTCYGSMTSLLWTHLILFHSITVTTLNKQAEPREEFGYDLHAPLQRADQWSSWWWPRAQSATVCLCKGIQSREDDNKIERQSTEAHSHLPFSQSLGNIICTHEQTKQYQTWHRPRIKNFNHYLLSVSFSAKEGRQANHLHFLLNDIIVNKQ